MASLVARPSRKILTVVASLAILGTVGTVAAATALEMPAMPSSHEAVKIGFEAPDPAPSDEPTHHSGGCSWGGGWW